MGQNLSVTGLLLAVFVAGANGQEIAMITDSQVEPAYYGGNCYGGGCYDGGCYGGDCYGGGCAPCDLGCGECDLGKLFFDFDATFFKYHQSGGVKSVAAGNLVGGGDGAEFDFNFAPRFTTGYQAPSGMGIRAIYWTFDDSAVTENGLGFVDIEAETFDLEVFKSVSIGCSTTAEVMAGLRVAKFEQRDDSDLDYEVDGTGLTMGLELSHRCGCNQRVYARARGAIVQGDSELDDEGSLDDFNGVGIDNTIGQMEIATGWEGRKCMGCGTLVYGAGVELQQWFDVAVAADADDEAYLTDAGWGGFTLRLGYEF